MDPENEETGTSLGDFYEGLVKFIAHGVGIYAMGKDGNQAV